MCSVVEYNDRLLFVYIFKYFDNCIETAPS